MPTASHEIMRVFAVVAPEVIGNRKWRKVLFRVHRELLKSIPENGVGPVIAARRDAVMIMQAAMRLCLVRKA